MQAHEFEKLHVTVDLIRADGCHGEIDACYGLRIRCFLSHRRFGCLLTCRRPLTIHTLGVEAMATVEEATEATEAMEDTVDEAMAGTAGTAGMDIGPRPKVMVSTGSNCS